MTYSYWALPLARSAPPARLLTNPVGFARLCIFTAVFCCGDSVCICQLRYCYRFFLLRGFSMDSPAGVFLLLFLLARIPHGFPSSGLVIASYDREDSVWICQLGVLLSPALPTRNLVGFASYCFCLFSFACEESAWTRQLRYCICLFCLLARDPLGCASQVHCYRLLCLREFRIPLGFTSWVMVITFLTARIPLGFASCGSVIVCFDCEESAWIRQLGYSYHIPCLGAPLGLTGGYTYNYWKDL